MTFWLYDAARLIAWGILRIYNRLEVRGGHHVPRTGPCIIAANHVSFIDPPVLSAACRRRLRFVAGADLFREPCLGRFLRAVQAIPLTRSGETDFQAIRQALRCLGRGEAIAIFPEGVRQLEGAFGVAKRGVGLLASAARAPIIPVYLHGTSRALPPDARRLSPRKIRVAFGQPISYTSVSAPSPALFRRSGSAPGASGRAARSRHEQLTEAVTLEWCRLARELSHASQP